MYIKLYIICQQLEKSVKYNTFNIYWEISVLVNCIYTMK